MKRTILTQGLRQAIFILPFYLLTFLPLSAQSPAWVKKAAGAVFTLKTFDADGQLLASGNGFFISENGEAVSSFAPFKNAHRAVVIDNQGKEWAVENIIGANDMYDVAKFQVSVKKPMILTVAQTAASIGTSLWLLPYSVKKTPTCLQGSVTQAEQFQNTYTYYTLNMTADDQHTGCPILNEAGEVIGMLQSAVGGQGETTYAVGANFAVDIKATGLSFNDIALRSTQIAKALPNNYDDAVLSLYIAASVMNVSEYNDYINRFIAKFPYATDGYVYRARLSASEGQFDSADSDMRQAIKVAEKKDDAHYQFAQMIFQKAIAEDNQPYEAWSLERALEESKEAYAVNPQPVYRQQQAQILYAQQKFDEACNIYLELTKSDLQASEMYYAASQCKLQANDKKAAIVLMDSAVNQFTKPYTKTVAPYLRIRAQLSMETRRFQQAINDMNDLVTLIPGNPELWAEKASYELRVNLIDQALESATECMRLDPEGSDGYLMAGIAQCQKGQKEEGMKNLQKAKELGNDQAQTFIDKYSK
jgi:tetratricopeptide (TPR) repeat protein